MPFNNLSNGFQNETAFIKKLHYKLYKNIDFLLQLFLEDIFGYIKETAVIECYKNKSLQKYDIVIKICHVEKLISIKKGVKNSVHTEPISEFVHFLIENKMPKELVVAFLKYHYADGTTNGTGETRLSIEKYKLNHKDEIDQINNFINQKQILINAVDRFVLKGNNSKKYIDAIIYGVPEDFIWIKRNDIYESIISKKNILSSAIHFGSLTYQPENRCLNYNLKYEKCRFISQIKWYNLCDDIIENMNKIASL